MQSEFFDNIDNSPKRIHLPDGMASDIRQACRKYEGHIHDARGIDLQVLGIGSNGHIGFNESNGFLASRTWIKILSEQAIRDNSLY